SGEQHDGQRLEADVVQLLDEIVAVERTREDDAEGRQAQQAVRLDVERGVLEPVLEDERHAVGQALRTGRSSPSSWSRNRLISSRSAAAFSKSRLAAAAFI